MPINKTETYRLDPKTQKFHRVYTCLNCGKFIFEKGDFCSPECVEISMENYFKRKQILIITKLLNKIRENKFSTV